MSSTISQEEDIAQLPSWPPEECNTQGKGKEHTGNQDSSTLRTSSDALDTISYPPINDDAEETRRVEENLRRWEVVERQRRKAARESSQKPILPYVGGTSQRASLLWQGKKSNVPSIGGLGAHTVLQSQDNIDTLPLREVSISPTPTNRSDSEDGHTVNPFANPPDSLSPFSDVHQPKQLEPMPVPYESEMPTPVSITFQTNPQAGHPPPPQPLSLSPPRTPPPIANLTSIAQSNSTYGSSSEHLPRDTRWWHEWLCGCSEGPDRGGDNQAGRTNPFE